jgi:hypothetical protein
MQTTKLGGDIEMSPVRIASLILALIATALLQSADGVRAASSSTPTASLCSLVPLPYGRDPKVTHLVGVALPDTMLAGPGRVRPSRWGGHWGPGRERKVYGQLVRVDTLGGAQAGDIRNAFAQRGNRQVLLVPWDYDAACEPTYWTGSAAWVTPNLSGFYTVTPRVRRQWVDGIPTFDAFAADLEPYPHGGFFRAGYRGTDALRTSPSLEPRELFDLYDVLPIWEAFERRDSTAFARVVAWARDNPDLAVKYPAQRILENLDRRRRGEF